MYFWDGERKYHETVLLDLHFRPINGPASEAQTKKLVREKKEKFTEANIFIFIYIVYTKLRASIEGRRCYRFCVRQNTRHWGKGLLVRTNMSFLFGNRKTPAGTSFLWLFANFCSFINGCVVFVITLIE